LEVRGTPFTESSFELGDGVCGVVVEEVKVTDALAVEERTCHLPVEPRSGWGKGMRTKPLQ
jgi:hypothetical protein